MNKEKLLASVTKDRRDFRLANMRSVLGLIAVMLVGAACENNSTLTKFKPAGVVLSPVSGPTSESGDNATFTMVLSTEPQGNVVVSMTSSDEKEGRLTLSAVNFTASDWNVPQTVTIEGVDDSISDGNQPIEIAFDTSTSQDPAYSVLRIPSLVVVNIDDDQAGFIVSQVSGTTSESEDQVEFSVRLTSEPTSDVTLSFDSDDQTEGVIDGTKSLLFTANDWNAMNKIIRVRGVEDKIADGNQPYRVTFSDTVSDDATYAAIKPADVLIINLDDDTSGINVSSVNGPTTEAGASSTFSVVLASEPESEVLLAISSNDTSEGVTDLSQLVFTKDNWNAPQNVTITGVDDQIADGNQPYAVQFTSVTSTDATYAGIMPAEVVVINIDNDLAGINVSPISGPTTEAGGIASFSVALASEPESDVTVNFDSDDPSEGTVSSTSLIFTPLNWNAPQAVTVTGQDDSVADGNQPFRIVFSNTLSMDATYAAITPNTVSVINTDNDNAEILVDSISGPTSESDVQTGSYAEFSIQLTSAPTAAVTINFDSSDQTEGRVSQTSITFTPANWSAQQVVRVTGQDDLIADGDQTFRIQFQNTVSTDPTYHDRSLSDIVVINNDNDSAGISVSRVAGFTTEGGNQATFTVSLNSEPASDVTVAFDSDDQTEGTVSPTSLIFTPVNWNAPQSVTVTGVDDSIADGNQPYRIVFSNTVSNDATYAAITPASIVIINTDDDSPGIIVSSINGATTESGGTASFTVVLSSQPSDSVTVGMNSTNLAEGTVDVASITFSTLNWNVPQTVTVAGVDDNIADGNQAFSVEFSIQSNDNSYALLAPPPVRVVNTDNDSAGVTVSAISGPTTELGGTAQFTVQLNSQPTDVVEVRPESSDLGEGTITVTSLFFTSGNWNAPQTVTIAGIDDNLVDGNQPYAIQFQSTVTADTEYASISIPPVPVINVDDDTAGVTFSAVSGPVSEDGLTASFTVQLNSEPSANVQFTINSSDTGEGSASPGTLTFTSANWNAPQTVNLSGADDNIADGNQVFQVVFGQTVSSDSNYDALTLSNLNVVNLDDDSAGFIVSAMSQPTTESGGFGTFTVRLQSQPSSDVSVSYASSDNTEGESNGSNLVFTSANWNAPQTVTVTGQDDNIVDGTQPYQITFQAATSSDLDYLGLLPASVQVFNVDNDSAGYVVSAASGPVTEAGGVATLTLSLQTQPSNSVTLRAFSTDTTEASINPSTLVFDSANWAAGQTITVTGLDDNIADGNQVFAVGFDAPTTLDTDYQALTPTQVPVVNIDDDSAGLLLSEVDAPTTEDGGLATFTVALQSQPAASVSVSVASSDSSEGIIGAGNAATLIFTTANWSAPQTVTVTGQDDQIADGAQPYQINFVNISSTDSNYDGLVVSSVTVFNEDNDSAGIVTSALSGPTTEEGGSATFTVALRTQPSDNVTISYSSSDSTEGAVTVASLVFTNQNWNAPQTVTLTGVDDTIADGTQSYSINFNPIVSNDIDYAGLVPSGVTAFNVDDDSAGFITSEISRPTNENGGTANFTIRLRSQPSDDVSLSFSSSDTGEGVLGSSALTFTTGNWNSEQTVTLTGQDDGLADGDQRYEVVFNAATSNDLDYNGIVASPVTVFNNDNDSAAIDVSAISGPTTESGGTASFTVVLRTQPTSDVTIGMTVSDATEATLGSGPNSVLFTDQNWNSPQTVTVTGVDDQLSDGNQILSIDFQQATSADLAYAAIQASSVILSNIDNDQASVLLSNHLATTSEAGQNGSFQIVLSSEPSNDVTIPVSSTNSSEGSLSVTNIVFTNSDWNTPQTITVTGQDDSVADGNQAYQVQFGATTSLDASYNGVSTASLNFTNVDDETAGVIFTAISGPTTEDGGVATFTVALTSEPSASVTLVPTISDATEATIGQSSVNFTTTNWNQAQTVTLVGVDDNERDGNQTYSVQWASPSSTDAAYSALVIPSIVATNNDNDRAEIQVSAVSQPTTESGGQATFTLSLASRPSADVQIDFSSSDSSEGILGSSSVTFTNQNWSVAQTVTLTGVDDNLVDGTVIYQVDFNAAVSSDAAYSGLATASLLVPNLDNDSAGIEVTAISGPTTEAGGTATASVTLTSQPQGDVTISLQSSDTTEGTASPSSMTFTPSNWNQVQRVTVTGVDDALTDGAQSYVVNVSVTNSGDSIYSTLTTLPSIPVLNTDDDFSLNLGNAGSVLIFATTGGGTSLEDAADNLGANYTYTTSEFNLITAFDQGGFELLVIEHGVGSLSQDVIQRIIGWVNRGNKLILSYGELHNHNDLLAAVGVTVAATTTVARDIYQPAARPVNLFGLPIERGGYNTWSEFLYLVASPSNFGLAVSGAELGFGTKSSGESELGLILGRYDSSQTGAPAIMMTKHGRVIVHGFSTRPYAGSDIDGDSTHDLRELFENEILYFLTRSELGIREDMVRMPAGTFTMGAALTDPFQDVDEYPRDVTISRDFQLGRTEVTNRLYGSVMGFNSSIHFTECGYGCPTTEVTWDQAVLFANAMSVREGRDQCYQQTNPYLVDVDLSCNGYRLPTEAEWEYSAKAGTSNMLSSGNFTTSSCGTTETNVTSVAWFCGNAGGGVQPVAHLEPNANGLYDMHGNVWEWVTDVYGNYPFNDETDPIGITTNPTSGQRVIRGGAYNSQPSSVRSTYRNRAPRNSFGIGYNQVGLRLARTDVSEDWFKVDVLANAQPVPSTGAAVTFSSPDDSIFGLTIPFTFNFMGSDETLLYVATNGIISFEPSNLGSPSNRPIPLGGPPSALIAGWWDDLDLTTSGAIRQETTGVAPNRVFAIHFDDVPRGGGSGSDSVSMSFYLFETSNVIEVHYENISGTGWTASAGWEADIAQTSGADVFGCVSGCDENDFPTGQILRYTPIRVR